MIGGDVTTFLVGSAWSLANVAADITGAGRATASSTACGRNLDFVLAREGGRCHGRSRTALRRHRDV
jgi:hypothetical protein